MAEPLPVDVWSDIMCPFCYLGDTLLQRAIDAHDGPVTVRYHSLQLMPQLPEDEAVPLDQLLEQHKGISREQARTMNAQLAARGAELGLDLRFDVAIGTNTRAAHRLLHFAATQGRQHELATRLFRGYFTDGLNVGDADVLADLAADVGLERVQALEVAKSDAYSEEVGADIREAQRLGVTGVPFFVFGGRYAVVGAQPVEVLREALTAADQ